MKESIGIIGSACRFPGAASSPSKLWDLLKSPKDVKRPFPSDRLNLSRFHHPNGEHHGSTDVENASYLLAEDPRLFDASFFNINPLEADSMDPQQRILLETVYEALEASGLPLESVHGSQTSVFVGLMNADYYDLQLRDLETLPNYAATGSARSIVSNRISYFFNLHGPSMTIDTACSSSLVALHQAVQSLRNGDSEMAIVAGANLILDPSMYVAEAKLHMLSPDARSRMWDAGANGYARGEGFAAMVLKKVSRAEEDGDHIECVVRETAVNSDGRTKGITMPSAEAQTELIKQAYREAGLDLATERCQYFECHGTGTQAGDPQEAQAIRDAFFPVKEEARDPLWTGEKFEERRPEPEREEAQQVSSTNEDKLVVGSIKTIIGHLEGCAGLAGVLKASLAIQNRTIPPNMLFEKLSPKVAPFYDHLHIPTKAEKWPEVAPGVPLRASVNSFGFGGTNAHAIIESYQPHGHQVESPPKAHPLDERFVGPLVLSAQSNSSLVESVKALRDYIRDHPTVDLADIAWVMQNKRSQFSSKTFFSGATRENLLAYMDTYIENASNSPPESDAHKPSTDEAPGILGIFTGQGAQWATMGSHLHAHSPLFRSSIADCEASLSSLPASDVPSWSISEELLAAPSASRLSSASLSQPLCTALQIGMVDLLTAAGIHLHAVVGHSSGEIAAAYAAGILSRRDAIRVAYYRGFHAGLAGGQDGRAGGMIAVGLSFDQASEFCSRPQFKGRLGIAASNAMTSVTLSGDMDAVQEAKEYFDEEKIFARQLQVDTAYHSHHMQPCARPYLESLQACGIRVHPPKEDCTWVSSVRGDAELVEEDGDLQLLEGQYWVDNLLKPVLFSEAVECALWRGGPFDLVVEIGPHPALKGPATQIFKSSLGSSLPYVGFMRRGDDEVEAFSGGVGYVWSHLGSKAVDFEGYRRAYLDENAPPPRMVKGLPSYAWDHGRAHWKESRISRRFRLRQDKPNELLGRRVPDESSDHLRWRNILRLNEIPWIRGHEFQGQVVFPGAAYVTMAVEAAKVVSVEKGLQLVEIADLSIFRAVVLADGQQGVEMVFDLKYANLKPTASVNGSGADVEAEFTCYICNDEASGDLEQTCTGRLKLYHGHATGDELPLKPQPPPNINPVDVERFYTTLRGLGLNYQGLFRGMQGVQRKLGYSQGSAWWSDADLGRERYTVHPAILDTAFHALFAAHASPATDGLHTPYLPIGIRRLLIDPRSTGLGLAGDIAVDMDAFVTRSTSSILEGEIQIHVPGESRVGLQVEGLTLKAIVEPTAANDRQLFAETVWDVDINSGLADLIDEEETRDDLELASTIERTALFYFRRLLEEISPDEIKDLQWHFQRLMDAVQYQCKRIEEGRHPAVSREWINDSEETILNLIARYPGQIDLELMQALAAKLPSIVRGETPALQVMTENNMLSRYYVEACGFRLLNQYIARAIRQITHRYPQARILEIGAGTGGTSKGIFDAIGDAFSAYAFTDVSPGFFEKAAERFADHRHKMAFKLLDIERDPEEQDFEAGGYDIIVASNVLHATRKLTETMHHVRKLLRPGGYLVLLEVTGDLLRMPFQMGTLPGWWLGAEEGRRFGPGISSVEWNELLQDTGFSGVDILLEDMPESVKHCCSMLVSQAVDDGFSLLREPLPAVHAMPVPERLMLLGGTTLPVAKVLREVQKLLQPWRHVVQVVRSLDELEKTDISPFTSVISFLELDQPLFATTMTDARFRLLKDLMSKATSALWLTSGRLGERPEANMFVGMGRALRTELPQLQLQFMDTGKPNGILQGRSVVEAFLRLWVAGLPAHANANWLWDTEPELVLEGEQMLVPRLKHSKALNNRLNASRRLVTETVSASETSVELVEADGLWLQAKQSLSESAPPSDHTRISVRFSAALPIPHAHDEPPYLLSLGYVNGTDEPVLAISEGIASIIDVPTTDVFKPTGLQGKEPSMLHRMVGNMVAQLLYAMSPAKGTVLIYEADDNVASTIRNDELWTDRKVVFATSKPSETAPAGWIHIHPRATSRSIQRLLPSDLSRILDLSAPGGRNPESWTPKGCDLRRLGPSVLDRIPLSDALEKAFGDLVSAHNSPTRVPIMPAQDLQGAPRATAAYPTVISWQDLDHLTVRIPPVDASGLFKSDKTYLMVGMTGGLGLSICQWMIEHGARHLVITSRRGQVEESWIQDMRMLGASVNVHSMDISDRSALRQLYKHICETMPPVAGVCNAAMSLTDSLFVDMDIDALNDTLKPKVDGTKLLDELFSEPGLDFFILFSSAASIVGNGGQSNYHAANMFMASLAAQRRQRGLAASIINIGMVADVGYVARAGRKIEDHLRKLFYAPLSETDIHQLLAEAVTAGVPGYADGPWDITMGIEPFVDSPDAKTRPPWYSNPRFAHLKVTRSQSNDQQATGGTRKADNIRQQLDVAVSEDEAQDMLQQAFSQKLQTLLQMENINLNVPLLDLGCDSLLAVEIRTWFLKEVHVDVPVLKVLSGDTVAELCRDAARQYLVARGPLEEKAVAVDPQNASAEAKAVQSTVEEGEETASVGSEETSESSQTSQTSHASETSRTSIVTSSPQTPGQKTDGAKEYFAPQKVTAASLDIRDLSKGRSSERVLERVEQMSYAQARLWFLREYLEDSRLYNITIAYSITGPLDVDRFEDALSTVINRHDTLRSSFFTDPEDGKAMQGIWSSTSARMKYIISADPEEVTREFKAFENHTWDLGTGESFGVTLISRSPTQHTLLFGYHHIVMDGVSWYIFLRDLKLAYERKKLPLPTEPYIEFAVEQRKAVSNGSFEADLEFWQSMHPTLPEPMPLLPFARVGTRRQMKTYQCHTVTREVGTDVVALIKSASRSLRVTPFHFHLAAIQVLLSRFLDIEDISIGVADANRTDDRFAQTVGFFLNLLPLRFTVDKESPFSSVVQGTSKTAFAALRHSQVPFDLVLDKLKVPRSSSSSPLFQVVVNYRVGAMLDMELGNCSMAFDAVEDAKNPYDLGFSITESSTGTCLLQLTSQSYLYSAESTGLVMDSYVRLLKTLTADPAIKVHQCPLYDTAAAQSALALGKGPRIDYDWPKTIKQRIDDMCRIRADAVAVEDDTGPTTYAELSAKVKRIASKLDEDFPSQSRVAVLCAPGADQTACLLAILKTGNAYVPLDLSLPSARHLAILESSEPAALLCHERTLTEAQKLGQTVLNISTLDEVENPRDVIDKAQADSPAFLLYTSGSTGVPKGVVLTQAGFSNHLALKTDIMAITSSDVVLQQSSLGFDMSLVQTFCALATGGKLISVPQTMRGDMVAIADLMREKQVTFTIATPSEYLSLLRYGGDSLRQYNSWRHACMGGEVVTEQLRLEFGRLDHPDLKLTNCYGPTEITAAASFASVSTSPEHDSAGGDYVSVGTALPNYSIYILDEHNQPLPVGVPGEICIGGAGIAQGYWKSPGLTALKFVDDCFASDKDRSKGWNKMYKTGDRGYLSSDGSLVFMGRLEGDLQVKIRGLRIELGEVENALKKEANGKIADAVVTVRGDGEAKYLVAHVVLQPGTAMIDGELQQLATSLPLPRYMCPARVVAVEIFPTTSNGKTDRKAIAALPLPEVKSTEATDKSSTGNLSVEEGELALLWSEVLQPATPLQLHPESDFFMVGGNSLLLVALQSSIRDNLGTTIPIKDLYQVSTLRSMSSRIHASMEAVPQDIIDWEAETAIPDWVLEYKAVDPVRNGSNEVLLTGAETFLGSEILRSLLGNSNVDKVHSVALPPKAISALPSSPKIVTYPGSLHATSLGLSAAQIDHLRSHATCIIHAGANGHCLHNYTSLRTPNLHSTHFLASLALPANIPFHFISSNRVPLFAGSTTPLPTSVAGSPPPTNNTQGFTASKWAAEVFLERLAKRTNTPVTIHRPCAVTGPRAPNDDALNAILRFATLTRQVPRFAHFDGYLDFQPAGDVAAELVEEVLRAATKPGEPAFRHYSSHVEVPVTAFRERMTVLHGDDPPFEEIEMGAWIDEARRHGMEVLITSYLEALLEKGERIEFPYLGEQVAVES